jgi:predicted DNA binding CopG/RHH family protein
MANTQAGKRQRVIPLTVPKFKSESEEADWWYQNRNVVADILRKHGRPVGRNLEVEVELRPTKLISIRLPEADIERAKKLAARKAIPYQTFLRSVLHEGLDREQRNGQKQKSKS